MSAAEEEEHNVEVTEEAEKKEQKKLRKRKRKLYKNLREQMEFYFSDANLSKDRFLSQIIKDKKDGYIPLELFKTFNKIKALTTDLEDIKKALSSSELLEIKDDLVRRIAPYVPRENSDECTIYVENLPTHADIPWVRHLFSDFGTVEYVSIPRYKKNNKIKGFAFVEFDNPESAKKALDYFIEVKPKESSTQNDESMEEADDTTKDHRELEPMAGTCDQENQGDERLTEKKSKKRKRSLDEAEQEASSSKRPKRNEDDQIAGAANDGEDSDMQGLDTSHKKKKKKKSKKKCAAEDDSEILKLRVISKMEWVRCRNKYLNLQKAVMSEIKRSLMLVPKVDLQQKAPEEPQFSVISFQQGVILRLNMDQPAAIPTPELKKKIQQEGVEYVDITAGDVYVRCKDPDSCQQVANNLTALGQPIILQGKEEEEYWKKLWKDQQEKKSKKKKSNKGPHWGKTKLLNKVNQAQSRHVFYNDD